MARVYIVTCVYHQQSYNPADRCYEETIEKVFKNEDKAIDYICDRIRDRHKEVDKQWPNDERVIKCEPDVSMIREGWMVESLERSEGETCIVEAYRYDSYNVE